MSAELMRLLANILRVGVVAEVNPKTWRVRVKSGELITDWLRWNTQRAGAFKVWLPPAVGEQVWLGCLGGNPETAVITGSLYSDENPAPGSSLQEIVITAPDGARFRYDAAPGALEAVGMNPDGVGVLTDTDQLWHCVRDILTTPLASRVMRREYGSLVPDLLDAPQNAATRLQLMSACVIALARWESRIALNAVDIRFSPTGATDVALSGLITESMQSVRTTMTLKGATNGNR